MKKATPKLYPFSYIKHEHDVQFRRYCAYNEMTPTVFGSGRMRFGDRVRRAT